MTVDLIPHILANGVDIQNEHLLLHRPVLKKKSRLSTARMFVSLYRLLLIHCIYVSVTNPACPAFRALLNTASIRPLKVVGKAITLCSMALPTKLCATLHCQSNVGSSLDLSVLLEVLSGVDMVTMVHVPEGTEVSTQGQHYVK